MVNIAFTGGGTGGHIYPGLAVIAHLEKRLPPQSCRIFWIGSKTGMDRALVEEAGLEFFGVPAGRLRRYFSLKTIPDMFRVLTGYFAARAILKRERPVLLFSKGGFVSVPPCAAAASLDIPVFTHESDYSPGLATRINIRFAAKTGGRVFAAYEDTAKALSGAAKTLKGAGRNFSARDLVTVSGNPVRPEFRNADPARGRAFLGLTRGERILLVLGGSQGARELNELVRLSLARLTESYVVVHQTGKGNEGDLAPGERYRVYPYFRDEMSHVLAAAELVLSRSGAGTVWESAAAGRPMVLVPLSGRGTRGDQVENARFFEKAGAAVVLADGDAVPGRLAETVARLAADGKRRDAMAEASAKTGKSDGAERIAAMLAEFAGFPPAEGQP
ncbi:MAG: undecaprenyldiphospho-muramoylpentapeptide beta-N-acetylglucosaminyltransferase [Treponema sp.]|jgi:UDP-N-acetylglucosamine--N-acetylmuramyl-(pentapeptide) pyrophosphoryl-undecaprenol N-acetylglucosamine transferase|nr:undecaprenyldiphospho-muramoylpentapeptide beta-N-acetylglucosaminyltransferase [Treponema sp.]